MPRVSQATQRSTYILLHKTQIISDFQISGYLSLVVCRGFTIIGKNTEVCGVEILLTRTSAFTGTVSLCSSVGKVVE